MVIECIQDRLHSRQSAVVKFSESFFKEGKIYVEISESFFVIIFILGT